MIKSMKCYILLLFALSTASYTWAQAPELVKLTPPSPGAMAFQKYGDIPISPYTGVPDISIPIYTVKFRDISIPISISYHASGIKVSEEASQEGLGWVLNASGTISRNIVGGDDFNGYIYFNGVSDTLSDFSDGVGPQNLVQGGCNLQMFNKNPGGQTTFTYDITSALQANPVYDFQPDQFYFNYPGHSGKFIMKRNMQAVLQKQEPVKIECLSSDGSTWRITSAEGFVYDFTLYETYTESAITHKSTWYLTKITSPAGNEVTFHYNTITSYIQSVGSYTETRDDWDNYIGVRPGPVTNIGYQYGPVPGKQYVSKVLSDIDFTNGKVVFNYSNTRTDLPNDPRLDSICIVNQGSTQPIKTFSFSYDYFNGIADQSFNTGSSGSATQRLKLTQLTEKGYVNGEFIQNPPYVFTYNEPVNAPAKTSFARDHWGYFNGITGRASMIPSIIPILYTNPYLTAIGLTGPERDPNPVYLPFFTLTSIKYPTGGFTEFQFEANDFDELQSDVNDHSYFATQGILSPLEKDLHMDYNGDNHTYVTTNTMDLTNEYVPPGGGPSPPVTLNVTFRFKSGTCATITNGGSGQMYFELRDASGNPINHVDPFVLPTCNVGNTNAPCIGCPASEPIISYTNTYQLAPGVYTWYAYSGTTGAATNLGDIIANASWFETPSTSAQTNTIITGGGLRIKKIIDHDGINENNNKIRKYDYHYFADKIGNGNLVEYSFGRRMSKPQYGYFQVAIDDEGATENGVCINHRYNSAHLMRSSDSENPLNGSASGAVVGYDQVTEYFGENGEFGKKVYHYHNSPDYVNNYAEPISFQGLPLQPPYNSNLTDPLNGSLICEKDYSYNEGIYYKVREVVNRDTTVTSSENVVYGVQLVQQRYFQHGDPCWGILPTTCDINSMVISYKTLNSEWCHPAGMVERMFNQLGDSLHYTENVVNYFYDNPAHFQLTKTVSNNSKDEWVTSTIKYPLDYAIPGGASDAFTLGVQNLLNRHIISAPVEKYVQKQTSGGTNIGATSYVLTSYSNTLPVPSLAYLSMLTAPNTGFSASSISGSGLVKDAAYQPLIAFDSYDAYGNLLQQHKVNDIYHSYIWDYNSSLPIAEVSNAASTEIAYTSFEADGTGNWTFSDTARNRTYSITGNRSYTISTGNTISKSGLTTGKKYVVSYWSRNGSVNVNSVSATAGQTRNGWTYYEHALPNTTSTVTVSGNAVTIDELRLFPDGALMTTYTHIPLLGLSSVCSPSNLMQYSVYDGMGRLKQMIDQDGNILKTVQYHYSTQ